MVKSEDVCFLPIIPIYVPAWGLPGEGEGGEWSVLELTGTLYRGLFFIFYFLVIDSNV